MLALKNFYIRLAQRKLNNPFLNFMRVALYPFSLVYGLIIDMRNKFFEKGWFSSFSFTSRIISIGNIVWGGTAKTSLSVRLAEFLARKGAVAVVYRGYSKDEPQLVKKLLKNKADVFSSKNRVALVKELQKDFTYIILDDGFQYRYIDRDIDIVLFNATYPVDDFLIPSGMYREKFKSLKRANCAVITSSDLVSKEKLSLIKERLLFYNPSLAVFYAHYELLNFYKGKECVERLLLENAKVGLLASIASPDSFKEKLEKENISIKVDFIYPDHYIFLEKDIERINAKSRKHGLKYLITTEKDFQRLKNYKFFSELVVVSSRLALSDEPGFFEYVEAFLNDKNRQ